MFRILIEIVLFIFLIQISEFGFLGYLFIREVLDAIMRYRHTGEITSRGLNRSMFSKEIPFKEIKKITGGYGRNLLFANTILVDVFSQGEAIEVCLNDKVITKLAKSPLNNWFISTTWDMDTKLIVITQGLSSETINISYSKVGKYALSPYLVSLIGFPVFGGSILGLLFGLYDVLGFLAILALFAVVCFVPNFYQQVVVKLDNKGILLKNDISERFLPYNQVAKVEKELFRIRVTANNGEVFYFPKACYLLTEFIDEFTKESMN